jgi:hypothetical protein
MRAVAVLVVTLAACTPNVFSEAYLCGPDSVCPEDQACNGPDHTCVLASKAQPFACSPTMPTEPDDTSDTAHVIQMSSCQGVPVLEDNCMLQNDAEDWVKFQVPAADCSSVQLTAVIQYPIAFEQLGAELWDLDHNTKVVDDGACAKPGKVGEENRCITQALVAGTNYGVRVHPTGEGNCDGNCSYNSYSLSLLLMKP